MPTIPESVKRGKLSGFCLSTVYEFSSIQFPDTRKTNGSYFSNPQDCVFNMFLFCLVFAMSLCASVYMCFVVTCWERADLLALVCGVHCEFVTFPLASWVRCGT